METRQPLIELKNVGKEFILDSGAEIQVLEQMNLSVYDGELLALLGPSGAGKSTTLRMMSGLSNPSQGEVFAQGKPLRGFNPDVAFVFQNFALFPWETVYSNIALALEPLALAPAESRARVRRAIDLVGLEGFEEAYPRELSGGMKQRVGLARALVMNRPILFLDEPFSALDVLTADSLRSELTELWLDRKTAVRSLVLVTHSIQEAVAMAKRILIFGMNPGMIKREILNDLPFPRDSQSLAFQRKVREVQDSLTEALIPDAPTSGVGGGGLTKQPPREAPIETLPNVQINETIGLLETLADQGGIADIFEIAHETGREFGRTLYLAKAAELFDLVDTPKHQIYLTPLGRQFVDGDINTRKRMLNELFGGLRIVQMTTNVLKKNDEMRMPLDDLVQRVEEWLPSENPQEIVAALIAWGRFSEYFGYNDDSKEVYLDVGQEITI